MTRLDEYTRHNAHNEDLLVYLQEVKDLISNNTAVKQALVQVIASRFLDRFDGELLEKLYNYTNTELLNWKRLHRIKLYPWDYS